jgi:transcriptional regulator with XRE-family HTH domain
MGAMRYDVTLIRRERMLRGWSQTRLAELSGVAVSTIHNVERGRYGKPSTIRRIADLLNIDMRELLIEESEEVTA